MDEFAIGAAGGLVFLCLFLVAPVAFIIHCKVRRFLTVCFALSAGFFSVLFFLWVILDLLDPEAGNRKWVSLPVVLYSFFLAFLLCFGAGIPVAFYRFAMEGEVRPWVDSVAIILYGAVRLGGCALLALGVFKIPLGFSERFKWFPLPVEARVGLFYIAAGLVFLVLPDVRAFFAPQRALRSGGAAGPSAERAEK